MLSLPRSPASSVRSEEEKKAREKAGGGWASVREGSRIQNNKLREPRDAYPTEKEATQTDTFLQTCPEGSLSRRYPWIDGPWSTAQDLHGNAPLKSSEEFETEKDREKKESERKERRSV